MRKGDIIVKLDGQKVSGKEDLFDKLQYYEAGEDIEMVIERASNGDYVEITLEVTMGRRP
jgi:serine protease Do